MQEEIEEAKVPENSLKISSSILDAFDLLKVPKDEDKVNGGAKIISFLKGNESEKDIQYVLKRLVRSLGANVPDMRTGYFATLVSLLTRHIQITVPQIQELIKQELHAASKSEVGDVALGQILVCGAIFRSGLLLRSTEEQQKEVIEQLLSASKKKSYLTSVAYQLLLDFVYGLDKDQFSSIIWPKIKVEFKKDLKEHNLDSLYFLLMVHKKFPEKVKYKKLMGFSDMLCEDNIQPICDKLMAGIDFDTVNHPIFEEIGKLAVTSSNLLLFWKGIDNHLVKHNRNRELVALNILTTILNNLQGKVDIIPELLSRNFFKLFMDWFKGLQTASKIRNKRDDEDDHRIMVKKEKEFLNVLCKALKAEENSSNVKIETLKKLLLYPGEMNFIEITGTSIIKTIITDLNKDGVKKMAKLFKGVLLNTSKKVLKEDVERNWFNNERLKAAELISYLVIHDSVKDDTEFKLSYMKLLLCFGFFKLGGDENVAISNELSGAIKACFYRCFSLRFSNVDTLVEVLSSLSNFLNNTLDKEIVKAKIEKQFSSENMECWKMLTKICQSIEKIDPKSKVDKVFLILLYQLGLFLFSEPTHVKMARSSIKELKSCYEHYREGKKNKPRKIKEFEVINGDEEPEWIEVLVEVLLSILSTESSILRSVVQCVFRLLWEYLTPSSISQIISILDPNNDSNPLTQDSDSEEDEDDDDDDNNDKKEDKSNGMDNNEEHGSEESESDMDVEDQEDDDSMKTPDQLRMAVQKALGSAAPDSDTESVDADMIDEEEGRKLDEALAEAFKQFHQGKSKKTKKERKDKKALSDFRIRVLDLIDIYLEKEPSMDICLSMINPLTSCLEFCLQDNQFTELGNRVKKTIKFLSTIRKFSSTEHVTTDVLCEYLKSVTDKGSRSHFMFQALGLVITQFSIFIIHCSQKIDRDLKDSPKNRISVSPLVQIMKDALQNYFQNRNCMLPIIFFHKILQSEWEGTYEIVPVVTENIFNKSLRQFRRKEGLELITGFYRALNRQKPTTTAALRKLANLEASFEHALTTTLTEESEFEATNNFYVSLRKLIQTMKTFHVNCSVETSLDFESLFDRVGSHTCKGVVKSNGNTQNATKQSNVPNRSKKSKNSKKVKRKLEKTNGHDDDTQHKKAKMVA